jgi:trk system potassium uptake protein TrkH
VVADTYTNWTLFGQLVILCLIQIGGLGFITIGIYIAVLFKKKIGLKEREAIHESVNTLGSAGSVRLTKKIIRGTVFVEAAGALLLSLRFIPRLGIVEGLYYGFFHAISAFCNAGFDLMGRWEPYSSLCSFESDILVNVVIVFLITIGGIGFIVWDDISRNKWQVKKYLLHTKMVLTISAILVFGGAVLFTLFERNNLFAGMSVKETILGALFCAVTPRTAGFNTTDIAALTPASKLLTVVLMFIGGSPGSTAGGTKTTTVVVMLLSAIAMIRSSYGTNIFGRRLEEETIKKAATVFMINLTLAVTAVIAILAIQQLDFLDVLLEVFSAIGTVGMSTGVTRQLCFWSKLIIIFLMYCGRLGSLTFVLVLAEKKVVPPIQYPQEKILVG